MELIEEVVSKYKRQKLAATDAVDSIKLLLAFVPSSDDEDTVPSGNRITIPQHQIVPWNRGLQPPPGSSSRPASAISPEATVGEAGGHGSGLL